MYSSAVGSIVLSYDKFAFIARILYSLDYPHLDYPNTLDYPNREAMASIGDLNYFTYPNFNYPNPQGVRIIEVAL